MPVFWFVMALVLPFFKAAVLIEFRKCWQCVMLHKTAAKTLVREHFDTHVEPLGRGCSSVVEHMLSMQKIPG